MVLLFLETIGTSELLLILVAALVVFGPRRLPELGRKLGKSMAEFRRVSDDFKRTWEREVDLDRYERERKVDGAMPADDGAPAPAAAALPAPAADPLTADAPPLVVAESATSSAREPRAAPAPAGFDAAAEAGAAGGEAAAGHADRSARKSDWL